MKLGIFLLNVYLLFSCGLVSASPDSDASKRAKELAVKWSEQRYEPTWRTTVVPEYLHPDSNDSGIPARYPDFLPNIDMSGGTFLITKAEIGNVTLGKSSYILRGRENVYCVEIRYTTVAEVNTNLRLYPTPRTRSKYFVMARDKSDNKWKFVDSYPSGSYFYSVPYFLKSWEKISGKGTVANIDNALGQLKTLNESLRGESRAQ